MSAPYENLLTSPNVRGVLTPIWSAGCVDQSPRVGLGIEACSVVAESGRFAETAPHKDFGPCPSDYDALSFHAVGMSKGSPMTHAGLHRRGRLAAAVGKRREKSREG